MTTLAVLEQRDGVLRKISYEVVTAAQRLGGAVEALVCGAGPVQGADQATVQRLVTAAAGIDTNRGDTVAVDTMAFDQTRSKEVQKELRRLLCERTGFSPNDPKIEGVF